jgi:hypothetical protein
MMGEQKEAEEEEEDAKDRQEEEKEELEEGNVDSHLCLNVILLLAFLD